MQPESTQGLFPIGIVSRLTGVNSVTLRAWERRYGLINPVRTESGHRLYSDQDIERIKKVLQLLDAGVAISRAKDALNVEVDDVTIQEHKETHWSSYQEELLRGINQFDERILDAVYNEAMSLYPVDVVTRQLLLPLLEKLGKRWEHVRTGVAEEHFFSVFIRNKLGARFHHRNQQCKGPQLVAACIPGEYHEFGLLMFTLAAHERGYRIILLGSNMPLDNLAEVVHRTNSRGIVLSTSVEYAVRQLHNELKKLVTESNVPVWVGGNTSISLREHIEDTGAYAIGDDLAAGLHIIENTLSVQR